MGMVDIGGPPHTRPLFVNAVAGMRGGAVFLVGVLAVFALVATSVVQIAAVDVGNAFKVPDAKSESFQTLANLCSVIVEAALDDPDVARFMAPAIEPCSEIVVKAFLARLWTNL